MSSTDNLVRIARTVQDSIVDGPGLRYVVFVQGCAHDCPGCHNPDTHNPAGGALVGVARLWEELRSNPLTMGLTLSGGEPFLQPRALAELAGMARGLGLNVWTYTGYLYEDLLMREACRALLEHTDVLVDGPFVLERKTLALPWRGSANQRLVDVRESLKRNEPVLYEAGRDC